MTCAQPVCGMLAGCLWGIDGMLPWCLWNVSRVLSGLFLYVMSVRLGFYHGDRGIIKEISQRVWGM